MGVTSGSAGAAAEGASSPSSRRRAYTVRGALKVALDEARAENRMTAEHEVRGLVADRLAAAVDRAAKDEDTRGLLSAAERLAELLDTLPIRKPGGGAGGDSGSGGGNVSQLFTDPPTLGNASHS